MRATVTNNGAVVTVESVWICRLAPEVLYLDIQTQEKYVGSEGVGEAASATIVDGRISVLWIADSKEPSAPATAVDVFAETNAERALFSRSTLLEYHGRHVAGFYLVPDLHKRDETKCPIEDLWTDAAEGTVQA